MTNWSKPQRRRLVIVRRRIGTPPTGSSVFGVSSEWGRSRVAQPAARMTAFIFGRRSASHVRAHISGTYDPEVFNFEHLGHRGALEPSKSCHLAPAGASMYKLRRW